MCENVVTVGNVHIRILVPAVCAKLGIQLVRRYISDNVECIYVLMFCSVYATNTDCCSAFQAIVRLIMSTRKCKSRRRQAGGKFTGSYLSFCDESYKT